MELQEFWNQFIHTGEPTVYFLYRGRESNKERYGASNAQRTGHSRERFR